MTSGCLRIQRLVRQRIHALRQFMEFFSRGSHIFYMKVDSGRRIQRYAWFNCGYMRCVCPLRLWIFTDSLREGGLGPCGGRRPGGQVEQFHGCCL